MSSWNVELAQHSAKHFKKMRMSSLNVDLAEFSARQWKNANVELECRAGTTFSTTLKKMRMSSWNVDLAAVELECQTVW